MTTTNSEAAETPIRLIRTESHVGGPIWAPAIAAAKTASAVVRTQRAAEQSFHCVSTSAGESHRVFSAG